MCIKVNQVNQTSQVLGSENVSATLVKRSNASKISQFFKADRMSNYTLPDLGEVKTAISNAFENIRNILSPKKPKGSKEINPQSRARMPLPKYMAQQAFGTDIERKDTSNYDLRLKSKVDRGLANEVEILNSRGEKLRGYFHKPNVRNYPNQPQKENTDKVVLFLSGSGGPSEKWSDDMVRKYTEEGVAVMSVNYRGFGKSDGVPSENGLYKDAKSMLDHLMKTEGIPPQNIVVHGFSLGGPVAAELVKRSQQEGTQLKGLFLDRPMASMKGAASSNMGSGFLGNIAGSLSKKYLGEFNIDKKLSLIDKATPVVLMTDSDTLGPIGDQLRTKAKDQGFDIKGKKHNIEHDDSYTVMNDEESWNTIKDNLLN